MDCMRNHFLEGALLDGRFSTIAPLNHGSFGMVFSAKDTVTGQIVAIKCLTKPSVAHACSSPISVDDRSEELALHTRIGSHVNIVNLLQHFETDTHDYLVLEFCPNGDLYEAIRVHRGPLETEHVREFMLQLVDAVECMHSKGIYHRDIKPENIFLTQSGAVKLGDFGLATTEQWTNENAVGSDRYMAPEQYDSNGSGYSPAQADIWALGICLLNILFSRNPFAMPTTSDPLYADFVADKQSLFDVFPTMSQDTFEVLTNCLAVEPANRSLAAMKDVLKRVVSFTTDDESLDDYCTADRDTVTATANREPLRTPSVSTPQLDKGGSFPWAEALQKSPHKPLGTLPAIADVDNVDTNSISEDLFPASERTESDWCSVKPDSASLASAVDSSLGMSIKSMEASDSSPASKEDEPLFPRSKPMPISGSLPTHMSKKSLSSLSSFFKKSDTAVSKSWSDMWDEDEEEQTQHPFTVSAVDVSTLNATREATVTSASILDKQRSLSHCSESTGRATPRAPLTSYAARNIRSPAVALASSGKFGSGLGSSLGEDSYKVHGSRQVNPSKHSIMDKWAALGDRRRGVGSPDGDGCDTPTSPVEKTRSFVNDWRRNIPFRSFDNTADNGKRDPGLQSYMTKDWRKGEASPPLGFKRDHGRNRMWQLGKRWTPMLHDDGATPPASVVCANEHQRGPENGTGTGKPGKHGKAGDIDDIGDLEWVGGWHDLHL